MTERRQKSSTHTLLSLTNILQSNPRIDVGMNRNMKNNQSCHPPNNHSDFTGTDNNWTEGSTDNPQTTQITRLVIKSFFSETFNSSFPVRPGSPPQKRKHKPWMTNGLLNACKKKNLLYKRFLTSRCSTSEIRYKTYKNKLTSILRYCEKQYYSDLLKANKNNMKETWKIINDLLKKKSSTRSTYPTEFMKMEESFLEIWILRNTLTASLLILVQL